MSNWQSTTDFLFDQITLPSGEPFEWVDPSEPVRVPVVDLEDSDDDVIESSPRSFAQAVANAGGNRRRRETRLNLGNQTVPTYVRHYRMEPIADVYINLEVNTSGVREISKNSGETKKEVSQPKIEAPAPPKEPTCPICMDPFSEEMSTKCGHIFCKTCIKTVIRTQGKCPTCRKRVTSRGLLRVFLPS